MLRYTQSNNGHAVKNNLCLTLSLQEKIEHDVPTSRSPFLRPNPLLVFKKKLLQTVASWCQSLYGAPLLVEDDQALLYQLSPETRALLSWFVKKNLLRSWMFCRVAPGMPDVRMLAMEPSVIDNPLGYGGLYLSGANGIGTADTFEEAAKPALGEFIERLASAGFWWEDRRIFCSTYQPTNTRMLDPGRFQFLTPAQIEDHPRKERFVTNFDYHEQPLHWQVAEEFRTGRRVYVPVALCYMFAEFALLDDPFFPEVNSNGVAVHSDRVEASNRALIEFIERDIIMRTWYHKKIGRVIEFESLFADFPAAKQIADCVGDDMRTYLVDLTDELQVPTVIGVQMSKNPDARTLIFTAASDLSYPDLIHKVLTELKRFMNVDVYSRGAPAVPRTVEGMSTHADSFHGRGGLWSHTEMFPHIEWFVSGPTITYQEAKAALPELDRPLTYQHRQSYLRSVCQAHDLDVYFVEFKNEITQYSGLHAVRALVPNLVPVFFNEKHKPLLHPRFTHDAAGKKVDLNPIPHPYL